jgi:hypothetical protein
MQRCDLLKCCAEGGCGVQIQLVLGDFKAPRHTDRSLARADFIAWGIPEKLYNVDGLNISSLWLAGNASDFFSADWFSINHTVVFTAKRVLPGATRFSLVILRRNHISLPTQGLAPNDARIKVKLSSQAMGVSSIHSVPVSQAVGAFQAAAVSFAPSLSGRVSEVNISFIPGSDVLELESVTVALQGFGGCKNASLVLAGQDGHRFHGYWTGSDGSSLLLVALERIQNRTWVQLSVKPENHLYTPDTGVVDPPRISTNATQGPVIAAPMNFTRIGHFVHSEVALSDASTTPNISLTLVFQYNGIITPETGFELEFAGLRANLSVPSNTSLIHMHGEHGEYFTADAFSYDDETGPVVFMLRSLKFFPRVERISLSLSCETGMRLPLQGLRQNDVGISIWSNSTYAPMVQPEAVRISPPLGFYASTLSYGNPQAAMPSSINFSFTASGWLSEGDELRLSLPGFFGPKRQSIRVRLEGPSGPSFLARWNDTRNMLVLRVLLNIPPRRQDVTVPEVVGIRLPRNGTRMNSTLFRLSADTLTMGRLRDTPIWNSPPVGAVKSASLELSHPVAGQVSGVKIAFELTCGVLASEHVYMVLQGFSAGMDVPSLRLGGPDATTVAADWVEETSTVILTFMQEVASRNLTLVVEAANGIRTPQRGILAVANFTISSDAAQGPMLATRVESFPRVGFFSLSSLAFAPFHVRTPVKVRDRLWFFFTFQLTDMLSVGDYVQYEIPGVTGRGGDHNLSVNGSLSRLFSGHFFQQNSTVRLTAVRDLPSQLFRVSISPDQGLQLPARGLFRDDAEVLVSSNASSGPLEPEPAKSTQPVGFVYTVIRFSPQVAGVPLNISCRLELSEDLVPGEFLAIRIPGLAGTNVSQLHLGGQDAGSLEGSWDNSSKVLTMTATRFLFASRPIHLSILSTNGIRSTESGITDDQPIQVGTNTQHIIASNTTMWRGVSDFNAFGSLSPSSMTFSQPVAGGCSEVAVNFTLSCPLKAGEVLTVHLNEFEGPRSSLLSLGGLHGSYFSAAFDPCEYLLTLTAAERLPAGPVHIVLGADASFRLPQRGLLPNDEGLWLSSNASGCPVQPGKFNRSQAVGTVLQSALWYDPPRLQRAVNITLAVELNIALNVGDSIVLALPGFHGSSARRLSLIGSFSEHLNASWSAATSTATFNVTSALGAHQLVTVTLDDSNGLKLPSSGLKLNDGDIRIAIQSPPFPSTWAPILKSPGIGKTTTGRSSDECA